jgi:transposase
MSRRSHHGLTNYKRTELLALSPEELADIVLRLQEAGWELADRLDANSTTSSRPPSSDAPWDRDRDRGKKKDEGDDGGGGKGGPTPSAGSGKSGSPKPPGKRPGARGHWRSQPIIVSAEVPHRPAGCSACRAGFDDTLPARLVSAHHVLELERGETSLQIRGLKHCYFAVRCPCGHETIARPGTGLCSEIEGRKRTLEMSERCLVGPMLAAFIAGLALRHRMSRVKIQEFLHDWLGLELGKATINRCIHEFGCASEPIVEELLEASSMPTRRPGTKGAPSSGFGW